MTLKIFAFTAAGVFSFISILHGFRLFFGWEAVLGTWDVPLWVSGLAVLVFGYLGYQGFRLNRP